MWRPNSSLGWEDPSEGWNENHPALWPEIHEQMTWWITVHVGSIKNGHLSELISIIKIVVVMLHRMIITLYIELHSDIIVCCVMR